MIILAELGNMIKEGTFYDANGKKLKVPFPVPSSPFAFASRGSFFENFTLYL
jgi:hypothetical protein